MTPSPKLQINFLRNEFPIPFRKRLKKIFQIKFGSSLDGPICIWIDITNECNLRCIMCPQSKESKRKKMMMEMDVFEKIIDQVYTEKPWIILHVSGEPLLHKNLFEMIKYAKSKGCYVIMHTNATLLTEEMSMRTLQSPLDYISFSFDGATAEIYEKLRVGADFEQVKSQIETFLRLRREMKLKTPRTRIEILHMKQTKGYLQNFINQWYNKGVDIIGIRPAGNWLGLVDDYRVIKVKNFGYGICQHIFFSCAVLVDGTVVPCCLDVEGRLPMGNILKQAFYEIWNGSLYNRLRGQHLTNAIPDKVICHNCAFAWSWSKRERVLHRFLKQFIWNGRKTNFPESF